MVTQHTCRTCGAPRYHRARTGLCARCSRSDPELAARKSATLKARYESDPELRERNRAATAEHNRSPKMRELAGRKARELRIWEMAKGARSPEAIQRGARRLSETRLRDLPPEVREDYRVLMRAKVPREEAKAIVLRQHEERMAAFRRRVEDSAL